MERVWLITNACPQQIDIAGQIAKFFQLGRRCHEGMEVFVLAEQAPPSARAFGERPCQDRHILSFERANFLRYPLGSVH